MVFKGNSWIAGYSLPESFVIDSDCVLYSARYILSMVYYYGTSNKDFWGVAQLSSSILLISFKATLSGSFVCLKGAILIMGDKRSIRLYYLWGSFLRESNSTKYNSLVLITGCRYNSSCQWKDPLVFIAFSRNAMGLTVVLLLISIRYVITVFIYIIGGIAPAWSTIQFGKIRTIHDMFYMFHGAVNPLTEKILRFGLFVFEVS